MNKIWLTKYGVNDELKEMVVYADNKEEAVNTAFDLAKEELAYRLDLEELDDINYILKVNLVKDKQFISDIQNIFISEIKEYVQFEAISLKNEYTINLNSLLDVDKQYDCFIRTLIKANGCDDIEEYPYIDERKEHWFEEEIYSKKLYIISGLFSDVEIKMLKQAGFNIKNN